MAKKDLWIEYDAYYGEPEPGRQEWGKPELSIEHELEDALGGEHVVLCGSGTDLISFRRDVDWEVEGDLADVHEVMRHHPEVDYRLMPPYGDN